MKSLILESIKNSMIVGLNNILEPAVPLIVAAGSLIKECKHERKSRTHN